MYFLFVHTVYRYRYCTFYRIKVLWGGYCFSGALLYKYRFFPESGAVRSVAVDVLTAFRSTVNRELVECNVCGIVLQMTDTNVHIEPAHYKTWHACEVQATLYRAIRGEMYSLLPNLDPNLINIAV